MASQPIFGLMEDREGNLWIGDSDSAVIYRDGRFRTVVGKVETAGKRVWAFAQAPGGAVWIATGNGLVRWREGVTRVYQRADGLPTDQLRSVAFDRDGTLWVATTGWGLVSFDATRFDVFDKSRGFLTTRSGPWSPWGEPPARWRSR